jgi:transposase
MSASLLYHTQNIIGYVYERTYYEEGTCIFQIHPQERLVRCPVCGSHDVQSRGSVERTIMLVPTGTRKNYARLNIPRVYCPVCKKLRQIEPGFADRYRPYSRPFERYVRDLCRIMTISDVARWLDIPWTTVKEIHKCYLNEEYGEPSLKRLSSLAIDEISIGKGHKYLTVVLNLETGAVVFVGEGKGTESLEPFWKRLGKRRYRIRSVAIDMSAAFTKAVRENLPKATLVYDHFHVVKLYNEKLSDLRREVYRTTKDADEKKLLKGTRWLLLKNPENLDEKRGEVSRLSRALSANEPLMKAYYLKEALRHLWSHGSLKEAEKAFDAWLEMAKGSGVGMLEKFAQTLKDHGEGILNYHKCPISTGPLEGTNTKIRVLQRRAYGFRDHEYLKLRIYALHEILFKIAI